MASDGPTRRPIAPHAAEVRGSRRVLLPVLAGLGVLSLLSSVSWFRAMEVSAPHFRIQHVGDAADADADRIRAMAAAALGGGGGGGTDGGARGGGGARVPDPARAEPDAPAAQPLGRACVVSRIVPAISDCLLRPLARSNVVINSVADRKYKTYAVNYVRALRAAGVRNFIMGSLDAELLETFRAMRAPAFSLANITAGVAWHAANRQKIRVVLAFLEVGVGILFTDIDVMFFRDPMPFIDRWPHADQLVSSDLQYFPRERGRRGTRELEDVSQFKLQHASPLNVGIMLVRPCTANVAFVSDWLVRSEREMHVSMQAIYDILLRTNHTCTIEADSELATCYRPPLRVGLLPIEVWSNGYTYFINHLHEKANATVVALHPTFQVHQGALAKIHRLREARLFFDDDDYYSPARKLLTYTPALPRWLREWGPGQPTRPREQLPLHFEAVHVQLGQLRWALALARALGRTLVLPRFTCLLDNSWYPMMGGWPGFRFVGPFHCPADHVLNFEKMKALVGEDRYREHSYLDNARAAAAARAPPRVVRLGAPGDAAAAAAPRGHPSLPPAVAPAVLLPRNATSAQALAALGGLADAVLHFEEMAEAFSTFVDPAEHARFEAMVKGITTLWCCVDESTARELGQGFPPGHVYYDPFWDRPHRDRFGREQGVPWRLLVGERDMTLAPRRLAG